MDGGAADGVLAREWFGLGSDLAFADSFGADAWSGRRADGVLALGWLVWLTNDPSTVSSSGGAEWVGFWVARFLAVRIAEIERG